MKKGLVIFLLFYLFFSCAQQNQPLTGGPVDTIPPKIISSYPALNDTNFTQQKIEIKFSEFIVTKNIDLDFFSSPPFAEKPKFKVARRKLIISLKEPLLDSVTYTFNFGNSIVDLHEGNTVKNFDYVFSTYDSIDYHQVSGQVVDAYSFEPMKDVAVFLYADLSDSIPFKQLPLYVTKTDSSGNFKISRIGVRNYKIFALDDFNGNFIYNDDENRIAFEDSLIVPWFKIITTYDTLDSGTVVVNPLIDTILDTLMVDSIKVNKLTEYYPDNLKLYMFTEGSANQEVKRLVRQTKGLIKLFFVKPLINNYIEIQPFDLASSQYFEYKTETFLSGDSIYFWFTNKEIFTADTLQFIAKYYDNDTVVVNDTISFFDYDYTSDTLPLKINSLKNSISVYEPFTVVPKSLIKQIDTSKIHLFELVDTVVVDEKKQLISVIRPEYDSLVFIFSRPIVETFFVNFENYNETDIPIIWTKSAANDTVFCKITNHSLALLDTLKFTVDYDNLFFFNQIQNISKSFKLSVTHQKITKKQRLTQDTILLVFSKNIPSNFKLNILDFNQSDYNVKRYKNQLKIVLQNSRLIDKDTLDIAVNFVDLKNIDNQNLYFDDTIKSVFVFDRQKITYERRYLRSKILLGFKKPFFETPEVELLSFNPVKKWNTLTLSPTKDTMLISIINQRVLRLNTMRVRISYFDINQHNDTIWISDTLALKVERIADNNTQIVGREIDLKLKRPVDFIISTDDNKIRNLNFKASFTSSKKYELVVDSAALIDLYGNVSDSAKYSFEVFSADDFASVYLNIKNIWAALDSVTIDTSVFYSLPAGKMILIIEDQNGDVYRRTTFNSNKTLKDPMFLPGTYTLKMFYDKNNNDYWDTGNYLKHLQSEKVFVYKTKINLSKGVQEKVIWDLSLPQ